MRYFFLALLARGPAHGYMLKQLHDELFGAPWPPMNIGQIYVTMGRLERDALVTVEVDASKKVYTLTELGEKELQLWMGAAEESSIHKSDLLLRLLAAQITTHTPTTSSMPRVADVIADCRQRLLVELRSLNDSLANVSGESLADLLVQQAALHIQADLKWLDLAEERFTKPTTKPTTTPTTKAGRR